MITEVLTLYLRAYQVKGCYSIDHQEDEGATMRDDGNREGSLGPLVQVQYILDSIYCTAAKMQRLLKLNLLRLRGERRE